MSELRASEQVIASTGADAQSEWVQLRYSHDGAEWHQRHHVRRLGGIVVVVTAQARVDAMPGALEVQKELVDAVVTGGG